MSKKVKIRNIEILSDKWYTLKKVSFDRQNQKGEWQSQQREAYDRGNSVTILLYNKQGKKIILTKQFRMPAFLNGNESGMLIETCAGLLDKEHPEIRIKKETEEETGYRIETVQKVFEAYMSPGAITEIMHFFVTEYAHEMKVNEGGGLESEQEDIEVIELDFDQAYQMIESGEIRDAKTIMLLQYAKLNNLIG